jgi:hypothetical protein
MPPNPRYIRMSTFLCYEMHPSSSGDFRLEQSWGIPSVISRNIFRVPLRSCGFWRHDGSCKPLISKDWHFDWKPTPLRQRRPLESTVHKGRLPNWWWSTGPEISLTELLWKISVLTLRWRS